MAKRKAPITEDELNDIDTPESDFDPDVEYFRNTREKSYRGDEDQQELDFE